MSATVAVILNILAMAALIGLLFWMQRRRVSFAKRAMSAMALGLAYGAALQILCSDSPEVLSQSNAWFGIIGSGYVRLLQMIVIPLIFVSIVSAMTSVKNLQILSRAGILIVAVLVATTALSAAVGIVSTLGFELSAEGLPLGDAEQQATQRIEKTWVSFSGKPLQQQITEIIPTNVFAALSGQGGNATLSVVFFSILLSIAVIGLREKKPESAERFVSIVASLYDVVMRLVTLILRLTPYGVLALTTKIASTCNVDEIYRLGRFVVASYAGLIAIFVLHLGILVLMRYNPLTYIRKASPAFIFAFTSRSSAGTLPLTISTLKDKFGIPETYANLAGSFGVSIGQNGCAGLYPAMLAVMVAPVVGVDPTSASFLIHLVVIVAIASFGVAGVGGGATFSALVVLSSLGLPVAIAGLLIAIEPLIDMARTWINVSGAMTSGLVTAKILGEEDMSVYNSAQSAAGES